MDTYKSRFGEFLREGREKVGQTPYVMAILLNIPLELYEAFEAGTRLPDTETLKRLCMMMEWNYLETLRMIRNELASPARAVALSNPPPVLTDPLRGHPLNPDGSPGSGKVESLGGRLREVRQMTGQNMEIIAALLNLSMEAYERLENGEAPTTELLRRISMVYSWNYNDLLNVLRSEQARQLQPHRIGNPFPGSSVRADRLRELCRGIEEVFANAPEADQDMALAQMDLIRSTLKRFRAPDPPPMAPADMPTLRPRRRPPIGPTLPGTNDRKVFPS